MKNNNTKKNHQQNEENSSVDDFQILNKNFQNLKLDIESKFEILNKNFEAISSVDSNTEDIKTGCEVLFKLKGEMYNSYQNLLQIYEKCAIFVQNNQDFAENLMLMENDLQKIKQLFDVSRKKVRAASILYDRVLNK